MKKEIELTGEIKQLMKRRTLILKQLCACMAVMTALTTGCAGNTNGAEEASAGSEGTSNGSAENSQINDDGSALPDDASEGTSLSSGNGKSSENGDGGADEAESVRYAADYAQDHENSDFYVEPIENLSDDFVKGMDASAVLSLENSGVKYYDFDGNEADVFEVLADAGVTYIRLRVWNDPYDANGNGYGGGNNDVETAIQLGKRATKYGMKVCIDFHYSDFWADPKRQHAPKAWENMDCDEKCDALYDFTKESLTQMLDAGVDVEMVQIGNEINNGMAGEKFLPKVTKLLKSGSSAVREVSDTYDKDIKIAVHYTNIEDNGQVDSMASNLESAGLDYDIFGLSYYPFWDGSLENMQTVVKHIKETYGKTVMIMETSYCYTLNDGDGSGNSFATAGDLVKGYSPSVQGQTNMVRDVFAAANEAGASGVFYWEGTWLPVGKATDDNSAIWEKYGSGWASSYASDYDPDDAGLYYGGCSWENQALFDFDGKPLDSLNVFKYLKLGLYREDKDTSQTN